ncbi:YD repeat [Trinorchestia longiramus]|nr:YD repeat [Trinorchestia longiramus]
MLYHSNSVAGYAARLLLQLTPASIPENLTRVHLKITLEGTVFKKLFEADPNLTYTYTWNKRNVYKSKMYDVSTARVSVGYEYSSCDSVVWVTQTAPMHGFLMAISDVGGWNLDIHHMYNFEAGILQRGDGSFLELLKAPRAVRTLAGTGSKRPFECRHCEGVARDAQLLAPTAMASAPDGSVYVGDFNLIRRITPDGKIHTVLQLSATEVSYEYYMTVSPADGHLYVSDAENYRVIRALTVDVIDDPSSNFEVVAGNSQRCIPGDENRCGDGGPALGARLSHPKGLAIAADKTMYIADGRNLRVVDPQGTIHTLIGHHGHKMRWRQLPCEGVISASNVDLQWPTHLALSPLDGTLHLLDDHVLMQVTHDGRIVVRAGTPLHCPSTNLPTIGSITSMAFSPLGSLFLTEQRADGDYAILELSSSDHLNVFSESVTSTAAGNSSVLTSNQLTLGSVSAITVSPDRVLHVADQQVLKIYSLHNYLPKDDKNGDYMVAHPSTNEIFIFNRHGHHIETRDLVTGQTLYSFTYSKNTSVGRLSQVTDTAGNKIVFFRDYRSAVSHIENSLGEKFPVHIGRLGLMTQFSGRAGQEWDFTYDEDTGLLVSTTLPNRMTTAYRYDTSGRVVVVVSPTGHTTEVHSAMGEAAEKLSPLKLLSVTVRKQDDDLPQLLSLSERGDAYFSHGAVLSHVHLASNGSWSRVLPWGGSVSGLTVPRNSLVESSLPAQAGLLQVPSIFVWSAGSVSGSATLAVQSSSQKTGDWSLLEFKYLLNGTQLVSSVWDGSSRVNVLRDSAAHPILQVAYDVRHEPSSLSLSTGLPALNVSYDTYGRRSAVQWSDLCVQYGYDSSANVLSTVTTANRTTVYSFSQDRRLNSVSLPSGRTWTYHYDEQGGLRSITTPASSAHYFSVQPIFSAFVFKYTAPGATQAYRQHLDPSGRLLLSVTPDGESKILYRYTSSGRLEKIASGDGVTNFVYGENSLLTQVVNEGNEVEYKLDYLYEGRLLQEMRTEYSARAGLSNVKFTYDYDANMRITKMSGRIGGQKVKPMHISYSPRTGVPTNIGNFMYDISEFNATTIQDGTAIFSRNVDEHLRISYVSLNIHNMQVFTKKIKYNDRNKIAQTTTFTSSYVVRPLSSTKNYTYDADGQLISVSGKEPWSFSYDSNGNMLSLTYSTNTIPMKYNEEDKILRFGEGVYKYNLRGFISQNARDVSYEYNARGLLTKAVKPERFTINYLYDHERRLIARKDNFGNVTQFQYQDPRHPDRVTHIYNARDASLTSLVYDDRGYLIFAQIQRNQYYIASDQNGTPLIIVNRFGEVVREMMRSPFGQIIYDSNPYLYIPIDYCGGLQDSQTELVHLPGGRVYDPLIGLWLNPQWENIADSLLQPQRLSLYRPNANDPLNVNKNTWYQFDKPNWLKLLDFDLVSLAPQLSWPRKQSFMPHPVELSPPDSLWDAYTLAHAPSTSQLPLTAGTAALSAPRLRSAQSQFTQFVVQGGQCVSGLTEALKETTGNAISLNAVKVSALRDDFWPSTHKLEISSVPGPFGEGFLVSRVSGRAVVTAAASANPIFKDVILSVFNNSYLLDLSLYSHSVYSFYFVKDELWRAKEDRNQLNRLAGEVNITQTSDNGSEKYIDIKLRTKYALIHVRYGTSPVLDTKRIIKHAKKMTLRRAWADERARVSRGETGSVSWTHDQRVELLTQGSVEQFSPRYRHNPELYPELLDDPTNVQFVMENKRSRRHSTRWLRCWRPPC